MKNKWLLWACLAAVSSVSAQVADDPVVMKINGKDIHKSEFEYIYNKNSQQQVDNKSLDEYVKLFVNYKLKVAEAEAAGIDTTEAFRTELEGYRDELAKPYLIDSSVDEKLAREAYARMGEDIEVSHILIRPENGVVDADEKAREKAQAILDRIRQGEDFGKLAAEYSEDGSRMQNGYLGKFRGGRVVYAFETAAYALQPGEVSDLVKTQFGYHIIKLHSRCADPGERLVSHILLLLPRGATSAQKEQKEAQVKEIMQELRDGGDFAELAKKYSEDRGTASRGGELPWFGIGSYVKEFETAAYALENPGDISEPVASPYGWHIIKLLDKRSLKPFEQMRSEITGMMARDERGNMAREAMIEKLKQEYHLVVNEPEKARMIELLENIKPTMLDSIRNEWSKVDAPIFSFDGKTVSVADFSASMMGKVRGAIANPETFIDTWLNRSVEKALIDREKGTLESKYPEFKNLMNEYRDGMMLFEISTREVWDKASQDTKGLAAYFKKHRKDYAWTSPRFKGFVIQAINDSVANAVKERIRTIDSDSVITTLYREFNNDTVRAVRIQRGVFAQGDNAWVDHYSFNASAPATDKTYPVVFTSGKMLKKYPEAYTDVRGQVTADYQNYLEKVWIKALNRKYPVVIYKDNLKTVNAQ